MKDKSINERVIKFRRQLGCTQEELALNIDYKTSSYSQLERRGKIGCETLKKISRYLNVDILDLLYEAEESERLKIKYAKDALIRWKI